MYEPNVISELYKKGELQKLSNGHYGVPISIQDRTRFSNKSRSERRKHLIRCFKQYAGVLHKYGAEIDLSSISVSGQTINAVIPVEKFETACRFLAKEGAGITIIRKHILLDN